MSLQPAEVTRGQAGTGRDLTKEGHSPMLPKQGDQSRSGDSDQGQPRVQQSPDKPVVMRQVQGQASVRVSRLGITKAGGQAKVSIWTSSGKSQGPEIRGFSQLFAQPPI